ncbi:MAG: universal stress protein [Flavobacteriales bacterium]|nr:universal stress protein [Flavobacteriales bacterium]
MNRILLPTDGSDAAFHAARFAFDLFGTEGLRYTLVHTFLKPAYRNALLPAMDTAREADNKLRRFERRCRAQAGTVVLAKRTSPFPLTEVLNELAEQGKGELIVMGTQGEGNYGLVGSNTTAVVMGARVPVITVPSMWRPAAVKRILLANDGGPMDEATLKPLVVIARRTGAEVVVAHVRDNIATFDERGDRRVLSALLAGIRHSFVTVAGADVTSTLDELARQGRIQLMTVIHRKKSFWQRLFTASKARRMALHTTTPLLVLPEQR